MKNEPRPSPPPQSNLSAKAGEADASPASSLDEVRKRLQSFGYLNSRIERFYLASLSRSASVLFNRFLLSLRVGMLVGTLAALLMTAGTVLFNVNLLRKTLDLLLLFVYFEVFFVGLATVLEMGVMFLVQFWARVAGPRRLSGAGQLFSYAIGLLFFAYFFYWGRSQYEYLRVLSTPYLVAMVVVLFLSCIFVAECVWLGFLVAFRATEIGPAMPDWKKHGLEVMLALAALLVLIPFVVHRGRGSEAAQPPVAVLTTPDRWMVVGIDGLPRELLDKLAASGDAPFLSSIKGASLLAPLQVSMPVIPPVTWTTIATGVPPAEHGILMPEVRRWGGLSSWMQMTPLELAMHSVLADVGFGQRQPVSGYMRKMKSFWEILSDSGIGCGVANWWGSWPARPIRGWTVSERYYYKRASGAPPQDETFPSSLFGRFAAPQGATPSGPDIDDFYMNIFRQQLKEQPERVAAIYLPGLDILNYEFFQRRAMDPFDYTQQFRAHVRQLDDQLRSLQSENPGYHLLIIFHQGRSMEGSHSAVLVHTGAALRAATGAGFTEEQIIPLLLHTCGLPIARDMDPALIRALDPSAAPRVVASFPKKEEGDSGRPDDFNDLLVEQMKSLGYLQ